MFRITTLKCFLPMGNFAFYVLVYSSSSFIPNSKDFRIYFTVASFSNSDKRKNIELLTSTDFLLKYDDDKLIFNYISPLFLIILFFIIRTKTDKYDDRQI